MKLKLEHLDLSVLSEPSEPAPLPSQMIMVALLGVWLVVSCLLTYFFSSIEYNLFALDKVERDSVVNAKSGEYKKLKYLLQHELIALSACIIGYYASLISLSTATYLLLSQLLSIFSISEGLIVAASIVVALTFALLSGETMGRPRTRKVTYLYYFATPFYFFTIACYPFAFIFAKTPLVTHRLEVKRVRNISIDELNETLHSANIKDGNEREMLKSIVTFGSKSVDEIMRPRIDVVAINITMKFTDVLKVIRDSEYSRMPVFSETIDDIKGILYVKDLLNYLDRGDDFDWVHLMRQPYFVPETKKIDDLLREFQMKHMHMAIVVDEFGGTSGIVTLEDILEVIFGDISDEHDVEQKLYSELDKHNYLFEGKLQLEDFYKIPKIRKADFESIQTDADTIAGLILELRGDIPQLGDTIEFNGYSFKIVSVDKRRIKKIKLRLPNGETDEE